jgi:hypothetical protein
MCNPFDVRNKLNWIIKEIKSIKGSVSERYTLSYQLTKDYLELNTVYKKAIAAANEFYDKKYPIKNVDNYSLKREFIQAELAKYHNDYFKYGYHLYRQIEYITDIFYTVNPGRERLLKYIQLHEKDSAADILGYLNYKIKPNPLHYYKACLGDEESIEIHYYKKKQYFNRFMESHLFHRILYWDFDVWKKYKVLSKKNMSDSELDLSLNILDFREVLKYYRDNYTHFKESEISIKKELEIYKEKPEIILYKKTDLFGYVQLIIYLYSNYSNGQIKI